MEAWQLEQRIYDLEGIRVVIRTPAGSRLNVYNYLRKAADSASITEWLNQRVYPAANNAEVAVVDGFGNVPHGRTKLSTLRNSYAT